MQKQVNAYRPFLGLLTLFVRFGLNPASVLERRREVLVRTEKESDPMEVWSTFAAGNLCSTSVNLRFWEPLAGEYKRYDRRLVAVDGAF